MHIYIYDVEYVFEYLKKNKKKLIIVSHKYIGKLMRIFFLLKIRR